MSGASPTRTNIFDITRRYVTDSVLDETEHHQGKDCGNLSLRETGVTTPNGAAVIGRFADVRGCLKISKGVGYVTRNISI